VSYVRVATANLLHGRSLADGLVDNVRMGAAIAELDADVVALQEVDRNQTRSGVVDQTATVAAVIDRNSSYRFAPAIVGVPGGDWTAATATDACSGQDLAPTNSLPAAYGIGLVTRLPVERWEVIRLPAAPVRSPIMMPGTRRLILLPDEPRVAVVAVLAAGAAPFRTVAATHLSFVPGWNARQLRTVLSALERLPGPRLLLGDLNLPRWSVTATLATRRRSTWHSLAKVATFPGSSPRVQFDHIVADDRLAPVAPARAVAMSISDHRALVVDLNRVDR
jgi:endonuclease/exonuclease/phosphatase family metal-dependent hydrolase